MDEQENLREAMPTAVDEPVVPTKKDMREMYLLHLGRIFSNMAIAGIVLMLSSFVAYIFIGIFYLFLIIAVGVTLGILLLIPEFRSLFDASSIIEPVSAWIFRAAIVIGPITIVAAALSFTLLLLDRKRHSKGRLVFSGIILAFTLVSFAAYLVIRFAGVSA